MIRSMWANPLSRLSRSRTEAVQEWQRRCFQKIGEDINDLPEDWSKATESTNETAKIK